MGVTRNIRAHGLPQRTYTRDDIGHNTPRFGFRRYLKPCISAHAKMLAITSALSKR